MRLLAGALAEHPRSEQNVPGRRGKFDGSNLNRVARTARHGTVLVSVTTAVAAVAVAVRARHGTVLIW